MGPAYRIETARLVLRCWSPADAPLLKEAIDASLDHLRPWMPWANDEAATDLDSMVELLREFRAKFDLEPGFPSTASSTPTRAESSATPACTSGAGRHSRDRFLDPCRSHRKGLATESTAALTNVAFAVDGVSRVEIRCDPANVRSSAVPAKLGFTHEATLRREGSPRTARHGTPWCGRCSPRSFRRARRPKPFSRPSTRLGGGSSEPAARARVVA